MKIFWYLLYNLLILPVLFLGSHLAFFFNRKVRLGLQGRERSDKDLLRFMNGRKGNPKYLLFHCASLGEYEQIRPVLRAISQQDPDIRKIVSFFSSSGYDNADENADVDLKLYLPMDTPTKIRRFLNCLRPDAVVISKHDVWPNFVWALASRKIPSLLVNGTMSTDSMRSKPVLRNFFKSTFVDLSFVAPASAQDMLGFRKILPNSSSMEILGDTRYDQVLMRTKESNNQTAFLQSLSTGRSTFLAGSTWPSDEERLIPAIIKLFRELPDFFVVIVPHELHASHLNDLVVKFEEADISTALFSKLEPSRGSSNCQVVIVDKIGLLANIYRYGQMAYVGGSFGPGVHNVMEPAAYGIPVLFGPKIQNSPEASELQRRGAGFLVRNSEQAFQQLNGLLTNKQLREKAGRAAQALIEENSGATDRITKKILSFL